MGRRPDFEFINLQATPTVSDIASRRLDQDPAGRCHHRFAGTRFSPARAERRAL
ncbi:hypothetical protein [Streptomyces hygroscopicus]|uniref:hypothetical protein n=1 Tax=Streptomyces hygroscopicus TaxID=1912 RepID=UPI00223F8BE3|nr:hypothetical protein [Streptomyces hygroscopicus]